jgi:hypothetical protein
MSAAINWRDRSRSGPRRRGHRDPLHCSSRGEDWFSPARFWSWLDGGHADIILTPAGGSRRPAPAQQEIDEGKHRLAMDGAAVRNVLVPFTGGPAIDAALAKAGWKLEDLDLVTLHEANLAQRVDREGGAGGTARPVVNAGAGSATPPAPRSAGPGAESGELSVGKRFGLFGFGGGLSACFAFGTIRHLIRPRATELTPATGRRASSWTNRPGAGSAIYLLHYRRTAAASLMVKVSGVPFEYDPQLSNGPPLRSLLRRHHGSDDGSSPVPLTALPIRAPAAATLRSCRDLPESTPR